MKTTIYYSSSRLLIAMIMIIASGTIAQNQNKKWYFGNNAGLDFMTNPPTILNNSSMATFEPCSSICDAQGKLLFYTDGLTVWNSQHAVMANGSGLLGGTSTSTSGFIVRKPGSASSYYIFTLDNMGMSNGLRYSLVDMGLAAGMGSVTIKNTLIASGTTEKLTATRHCNGVDIWIVTHDYPGNTFRSFLVTAAGISPTFVLSSVGTNISSQMLNQGCMKLSPSGNKLCMAMYSQATVPAAPDFELFDFDNTSGIVSNPFVLDDSYEGYSCEFSPDGTKLYGSTTLKILQWDLCAGSNMAIAASQYTVANFMVNAFGQLQRATNDKIYVSVSNTSSLDIINTPNAAQAACNYLSKAQSVSPGLLTLGLPDFLFEKIPPPPFTYSASSAHCHALAFTAPPAPTTTLTACTSVGYSLTGISWNFGDPGSGSLNTSTQANPSHIYPSPGTYTAQLVYYYTCSGGTDTLTQQVIVGPGPMSSSGGFSLCSGQSLTLTAPGSLSYTWNTGALGPTLAITPGTTTTYSATGTDGNGCSFSSVKTVTVDPSPLLNVSGTSTLCTGSSVTLTVTGANSYTWSTNAFTSSVSLTPLSSSVYSVSGAGLNGCLSQKTLAVTVFSLPVVTITGNTAICTGSTLNLVAGGAGTYSWSNGTMSASLTTLPSTNAQYTVTGTSNEGCVSQATTSITILPVPSLTVSGSSSSVCTGQSLTLSAQGASSYTWSPGIISSTFVASPLSSSIYTVYGENNQGCTGQNTIAITVQPLPVLSVTGNTICKGASGIVTASGADSYSWSSGSSSPSISVGPDLSGTYTLTGTNVTSGCTSTSTFVVYELLCSGITGAAKDNHIRVYPNPFQHTLLIELQHPAKVCFYDQLGRFVCELVLEKSLNTLDLSGYPAGHYTLLIKTAGERTAYRQVIKAD